MKRTNRLKDKLVWKIAFSYLALTAVPFIVSYALTSTYWWNSSMATSIDHSEKILHYSKELVDVHLRQMESLTLSLYYEPDLSALLARPDLTTNANVRSVVTPRFEKLFRNMSNSRPDVFNYYYYDLNGNLIYVYLNGVWIDYAPQTKYNPVGEPWFRETVQAGGRIHIIRTTLPIQKPTDPLFSMSRLIKLSTDPIGVVLMDFNFNVMKDVIGQSSFNDNSAFVISDLRGNMIYDSRLQTAEHGSLPPEIQQSIDTGPSAGSFKTKLNGQQYLIVYETLDRFSLKLIHMIPISYLISENMAYILNINVILIILMLLLICVSLYYFNRKMIPLVNLAQVMSGSVKEPFDTRVPVSTTDEIGRLSFSFNKMMSRLHELFNKDYKNRLAMAESEKKMLEAQINPHFLYNTLDTIRFTAIRDGNEKVGKMLFALSTNLRYTISDTSGKVTVKEEVQWLERYIYLQQLRFQDRFEVFFQIDVHVHQLRIHRLILQPFIENSILHGFQDIESGGILHVNSYLDKDALYFEIVDNGCGFPGELNQFVTNDNIQSLGRDKIGMVNALSRLFLYYGERCDVYLRSIPGKGTSVRIRLLQEDPVDPVEAEME
ncbi:cache domain-containing sensor histidine kinase [Paenibacillus thalictri]|uniref:HAMP domain-containing protein n=1 Tax=Paenibacillus thalictri TaxID=2527873 RepID=A0A4Q9DLM4_9BACL|nr:sensor histidine kinase [Paenibacillus thalictri]TBL73328.1 HAMP domain-containing protein [Paenibacillus thalictri]